MVGYQLGDRKIEHGPAAARIAYRVAREDGAGYLEVYASDIANPAYEPVLKDLVAGRV